jgi:flagellar motor component MotA
MAAGAFDNWGDLDRMGPALAVAMLTVFYGYICKLDSLTFTNRA